MENLYKTNSTTDFEGIDFHKLKTVVRKNYFWIVLLFVAANLTAYLYLRWTKDLFEAESEIKLEIKSDATELGIKTIVEDQNLNLISGEIEQIKSKLFFNRIIDSLDIKISYYSEGQVLRDEMYKHSPFLVTLNTSCKNYFDLSIYFESIDEKNFSLRVGKSKERLQGKFNTPLTLDQTSQLTISRTPHFSLDDNNRYYFVINSRAKLVEYINKNIQVEPLNFNANTIRISFQDFNAQKAYDIVNKIDSIYLVYSYEQKNLANTQKIEWLNNELSQVEKKMGDFENYLENFTLQNKSNDLALDLKKTIAYINKIDSQRYDLTKKIAGLNGIMDELTTDNYLTSVKQHLFLPTFIYQKLESLQVMMIERDKVGLAYNENTFAFRQKEKELNTLKDQVYRQLADLKKEWLGTLSELNSKKEKLERDFASMPDKNTQFSKNQRYYKLYEEFYLSMMQAKAQFEIAQAGSTPNFKILSSANLPTEPIAPKKLLILGIGFTAGIVLNFFFIGIAYLLNNKINGIHELERATHFPILGIIPQSKNGSESIYVSENPKSIVSESLRSLRTNLDFFAVGSGKKIITLTSTISGEGKSFLAANLGAVLAMSKKKVVLIDLDMRKTKSKNLVGIDNPSMGVSTLLIKKNNLPDCIQKTSIENFDFIPSGPHPPNPSELLLNGEFLSLLNDLKEKYDFVLIDTPPVGLVTDGIMAMKHSDLSIYIFRANYSQKEFIHNLQRIQAVNKFNNIALVLNSIKTDGKKYGYHYYQQEEKSSFGWKKLFRK